MARYAMETTDRRDEIAALLELTDELVEREVRPAGEAAEESGRFPRELFTLAGRARLPGLPYPVEDGGGGPPHQAHLQGGGELAAGARAPRPGGSAPTPPWL